MWYASVGDTVRYHYSVREGHYNGKTPLTAQNEQDRNIKFLTVTITERREKNYMKKATYRH